MSVINGIPWKWVFVAYFLFVVTDVETARLTISPSVNVQVGSTAVTLRCEAAASAGYETLYSLEIKRNRQQVESEIALVNGKGATASTPKYTISSSYDINAAPTSNFLQVILNNPGCSDAAEFECISKGAATIGDGLESDRKNMTVQSNPETPEMFVDPDMNLSGYLVNSNVTFKCTGNVGNPQKLWSWRFRRSGSSFWQDFNSNADITDGEVTPPTATRCSYASSSTLKYTILSTDHEMMIMCRLDNNDEYSTNYTVKLRNVPDSTDSPNTGNVAAAGLGGGEIAGIVIAILIVIVIIVVVVIIVVKKKNGGGGKAYNTKEKDVERSAPVSTVARENEMKQNNKDRGHTNQTLDEPHERRNDRYDYRNGGHNNPGLDDTGSEYDERERRDPYLAEDGTDIRGSNAMLGSTV